MSARERLFERLWRALGRGGGGAPEELRREVEERIANPRPHLIPARAKVTGEERIALFVRMAKAVGTEIERVGHIGEVGEAVMRFLRFHNLPRQVRLAPDPLLDAAGFGEHALLEVRRGTASADDPTGVTVAESGVAETGTLVLASSPERPTMLAYLPENCVVVLPIARLDGSYEESWQRIRERFGRPPRSVNLITGPSRTADIGLQLTMGAHGPRRLLVVLVDRTDSA